MGDLKINVGTQGDIPPKQNRKKVSSKAQKLQNIANQRLDTYALFEDYKNSLNSLSKKSIDQINPDEAKHFISLLKNCYNLYEQKDPKFMEIMNEFRSSIRKREMNARSKILKRERMALDKSFLEDSKIQHLNNIDFLEKIVDPAGIIKFSLSNDAYAYLDDYKKSIRSISKKSVDQIDSNEANHFISLLKKGRELSDKQDPEWIKAATKLGPSLKNRHTIALSKVLEREKMALNKSLLEDSKKRHQNNIVFMESIKDSFEGQSSLSDDVHAFFDDYKDFIHSISKKSVDQIDSAEVDLFISLIKHGEKLINNRIHKDVLINLAEPIQKRDRDVKYKMLEREKMALNKSYQKTSKERHQRNIDFFSNFYNRNP